MKKLTRLVIAICLMVIFAANANAALIDNLDGTVTQTRNDGSMLMWSKDVWGGCTEGTWYDAVNCINSLNSSNYLGYNDWRLPSTLPANGSTYNYSLSYNGSTDNGYNITSPNSELSYMFYVELGNKGMYDTSGNAQTGYGAKNVGPFQNLRGFGYWSGTEDPSNSNNAWYITYNSGRQNSVSKDGYLYSAGWAVRDVTVVPEPISSVLFIAGGALFAAQTVRKRKSSKAGN